MDDPEGRDEPAKELSPSEPRLDFKLKLAYGQVKYTQPGVLCNEVEL
jgi:hypothetical protein